MRCPFCDHGDTKVINSRPAEAGRSVRRRRECEQCKGRFTTFEYIEGLDLTVVKRDGTRVPYSRENLRRGIEKATKSRPVTELQIDAIVDKIEREAFRDPPGEALSDKIGKFVLAELKEIDEVAYIRFASVYKKFRDIKDFRAEIEALDQE